MLAAVLDPFDRAAKVQRGGANQNVFRIKFAADAEAAANMALVELHGSRCAAEHAGELVSVPMRHLGGAVQFEYIARRIIAGDGAARFQRHAGMPPDR